MSAHIDGLDVWQLEVPFEVWVDKGGDKPCNQTQRCEHSILTTADVPQQAAYPYTAADITLE